MGPALPTTVLFGWDYRLAQRWVTVTLGLPTLRLHVRAIPEKIACAVEKSGFRCCMEVSLDD